MTKQIKQFQVAVSGYDSVAYFDGQAIAGDQAFSSVYKDSLYQFSNTANKQMFDAAPERYVPLYGGYCTTAVSEGKLFGVDPTNFKITDDIRLALFYRGARGTPFRNGTRTKQNVAQLPINIGAMAVSKTMLNEAHNEATSSSTNSTKKSS